MNLGKISLLLYRLVSYCTSFMAYHTLFYAYNRLYKMNSLIQLTENELKKRQERLKKMITPAISSVQRWWSIVKEERSPLWINILAATTMIDIPATDLIQTIKSLQYFPLDLINWGYHNTDRWDCVVQPYYGRDDPDDIQMRAILPPQVSLFSFYFILHLFLLGARNQSLEFESIPLRLLKKFYSL